MARMQVRHYRTVDPQGLRQMLHTTLLDGEREVTTVASTLNSGEAIPVVMLRHDELLLARIQREKRRVR